MPESHLESSPDMGGEDRGGSLERKKGKSTQNRHCRRAKKGGRESLKKDQNQKRGTKVRKRKRKAKKAQRKQERKSGGSEKNNTDYLR